eukprot:TRINITY_DN1738_c0_g1_i1.p1 TRINITY_DN1738_c0_g1~~TRINITY_DN1738_c0_g1_i1.p1  ORF type:complete len:453 (+),score=121.22 TRINITY_DN1738_c0_g1_i1:120-1478(+)
MAIEGETPEEKAERKKQEKALIKKARQNALYTRSDLRLSVANIYKAIFLLAFLQLAAAALQMYLATNHASSLRFAEDKILLGLVITESIFNILIQLVLVAGYVKVSRKLLRVHIYLNYASTVVTLIFAVAITSLLDSLQKTCNKERQDPTKSKDICTTTLKGYRHVIAPLWFAVTLAIMLSLAADAGVDRISRERSHFSLLKTAADQKKATASARKELKIFYKKGLTPARLGLFYHLVHCEAILRKIGEPGKKIFLSYAWYVEGDMNSVLQSRLKKIKTDLQKMGAEVRLDLTDMHGGIDEYMKKGIEWADHVLLICTPRLKARAAETNNNNLIKEVRQALGKHNDIVSRNPHYKFIIPLLFDGIPATAVPDVVEGVRVDTIVNLRSIDLSMENMESIEEYDAKYAKSMAYLNPTTGLIPMMHPILEREQEYAESLSHLEQKLHDASLKHTA